MNLRIKGKLFFLQVWRQGVDIKPNIVQIMQFYIRPDLYILHHTFSALRELQCFQKEKCCVLCPFFTRYEPVCNNYFQR